MDIRFIKRYAQTKRQEEQRGGAIRKGKKRRFHIKIEQMEMWKEPA